MAQLVAPMATPPLMEKKDPIFAATPPRDAAAPLRSRAELLAWLDEELAPQATRLSAALAGAPGSPLPSDARVRRRSSLAALDAALALAGAMVEAEALPADAALAASEVARAAQAVGVVLQESDDLLVRLGPLEAAEDRGVAAALRGELEELAVEAVALLSGLQETLRAFSAAELRLRDLQAALAALDARVPWREAAPEPEGDGAQLANLGHTLLTLGQFQKAVDKFEASLALCREAGDRRSEEAILAPLGRAYDDLGDHRHAIACFQQRLEIIRGLGDRKSEARTLLALGDACDALGEAPRALEAYDAALAAFRELRDRNGVARTLGFMGRVHGVLGDAAPALRCYEESLGIQRQAASVPTNIQLELLQAQARSRLEAYKACIARTRRPPLRDDAATDRDLDTLRPQSSGDLLAAAAARGRDPDAERAGLGPCWAQDMAEVKAALQGHRGTAAFPRSFFLVPFARKFAFQRECFGLGDEPRGFGDVAAASAALDHASFYVYFVSPLSRRVAPTNRGRGFRIRLPRKAAAPGDRVWEEGHKLTEALAASLGLGDGPVAEAATDRVADVLNEAMNGSEVHDGIAPRAFFALGDAHRLLGDALLRAGHFPDADGALPGSALVKAPCLGFGPIERFAVYVLQEESVGEELGFFIQGYRAFHPSLTYVAKDQAPVAMLPVMPAEAAAETRDTDVDAPGDVVILTDDLADTDDEALGMEPPAAFERALPQVAAVAMMETSMKETTVQGTTTDVAPAADEAVTVDLLGSSAMGEEGVPADAPRTFPATTPFLMAEGSVEAAEAPRAFSDTATFLTPESQKAVAAPRVLSEEGPVSPFFMSEDDLERTYATGETESDAGGPAEARDTVEMPEGMEMPEAVDTVTEEPWGSGLVPMGPAPQGALYLPLPWGIAAAMGILTLAMVVAAAMEPREPSTGDEAWLMDESDMGMEG